ncbi:MAG: hypothetical protein ABJA98_01750 [Acidobacteriota bacterium]
MPTQPAILGTARLGNVRLGYVPAAVMARRATRVRILIAEVPARVRVGSVTIRDVLNDAPNTCSLTVDAATPPVVNASLRITINSDTPRLLFAGALQTVEVSYEGLPGQRVYPCTAIDDTARANARLPFGAWTLVSATTIAQSLVTTFAPGFTSTHVQAALPVVSVNFDGSEGMNGCLTQLAKLIGGYFYWEDFDLHLFQTEASDPPDALDSTPGRFLDDPPIALSVDDSQTRTRVFGKGHGENTLADVGAGETVIPIADATMFNAIGGRAISETQPIAYTGVQLGGGGGLVGPGASPSAAPVVTLQAGAGVEAGVHSYAVVFGTAAGKSLPSPLATVTTGLIAAPAAVTATATTDQHLGQAAFGVGKKYKYKAVFVAGAAETDASAASSEVTTVVYAPAPTFGQPITIPLPTSADPRVTAVRLYRNTDLGATWYRLGDPALGASLGYDRVPGSTFVDPWADAQITGNPTAPSVSGTQFNQVGLSAVPIGGAAVTYREIHRTIAGGAQLKLQQTIANNTATDGVTDVTADASLGANAPTTDASGLAQPVGQLNAGNTSIIVAGTGGFAAGGGWAVIGNGQQVIRYTGVTGAALTGVPVSGLGAILATVSYNSTITAAPALTGVTGLVRALIKGAPVNLWVQRDDLAAQAALAIRASTPARPHDGIVEHRIVDERRGEASLIALCDADLQQFSRGIKTVPYACRDVKTKSGKAIVINLVSPPIHETLTIQDVTIDQIDTAPATPPRFTVSASNVRFSLEDLLRKLSAGLEGL